jgi:hypothetical protein
MMEEKMSEAEAIVAMINQLTASGSVVCFRGICFDGTYCVEQHGPWTEYTDRVYHGGTMLEALRMAALDRNRKIVEQRC